MPSTYGMRTFFDRMPVISERLCGRTERNVCSRNVHSFNMTSTKHRRRTLACAHAACAPLSPFARAPMACRRLGMVHYHSRELRSAVYTLVPPTDCHETACLP
jgi:hypothetical protein